MSASHKPMSRAHRLTRGRLGDVGLARGHLLPKAHGLCKVSAPTHPMTTGHRVMGRPRYGPGDRGSPDL